MATEVQGLDYSYVASSNVTALTFTGNPPVYSSGGIPQFYVVTADLADGTNGAVTLAASNTVLPVGVAQDYPAVTAGQSVRVRVSGVTKAIAGAAITVGALLKANASGQVVTASALGATNEYIIGQAETAATASGDVISVRLNIGASLVNA